jgi:hypothetical protein
MSPESDVDPRTVEEERAEASRSHVADRAPSEDEERAAEEGARGVDEANVAEHEKEMDELGANVKGEGEIA